MKWKEVVKLTDEIRDEHHGEEEEEFLEIMEEAIEETDEESPRFGWGRRLASGVRSAGAGIGSIFGRILSWIRPLLKVLAAFAVIGLLIFGISAGLRACSNSKTAGRTVAATTATGSAEQATAQQTTSSGKEDSKETEESETEKRWKTYKEVVDDHPWLVFHNFTLQSDGDPDNNANFGENRFHKDWTAQDYYKDWKGIIEEDPLVLISSIATVDAARGSRLCGAFYDGNDANWKTVINSMVRACLDDRVDHNHLKEVFFDLLRNEVRSVELVHVDDVHDQMLVDPYTYDGVPDLIVCEKHESGDILLITFKTKGGPENDVKVGFRIQCCYQPVDVADILNVEPEPVPSVPEYTPPTGSTPPGDTPPGGGNPPDPGNPPEPDNPPEPEYDKDPTKGTSVQPGNGEPTPSTTNGVCATDSSVSQPTNSDQGMTYPEYQEWVDDMASSQGSGSSDPTPSYTPPQDSGGWTVDNGGGASANDAATSPSYNAPVDGSALSSDSDGAWGGPPE